MKNTNTKYNRLPGKTLTWLMLEAERIRKIAFKKGRMDVCSIINAKSGLCSEDCKFCAQSSRHKTEAPIYPLKDIDTIVEAAAHASSMGAKRFGIVTSGNRLTTCELDSIIKAVRRISKEVGIIPCASLGAIGKDNLRALKAAGLKRYHHNIETSPGFYPKIVSTHTFSERVKTIREAKSVGLEVCSGGIIGLGESWSDRIEMALFLKKLKVDSVPVNLLVPIKGTPMENKQPISCIDALKTIAIFRIILKDKPVKLAAGRETILKDFQASAFMAGANGMLIGGYLTTRGRSVEEDHALIREIHKAWNQE